VINIFAEETMPLYLFNRTPECSASNVQSCITKRATEQVGPLEEQLPWSWICDGNIKRQA